MKYSIYVFLDELNRPYYVGKTNNMKRRHKEHLREIAQGNKLPKYNKARKLISRGFRLNMKTIEVAYNEKEAYRLERYYIRKYRNDNYQLLNCTSGGPHEHSIRINVPKKPRKVGILTTKLKRPVHKKAKTIKRKRL